jgi:hypothetical protein
MTSKELTLDTKYKVIDSYDLDDYLLYTNLAHDSTVMAY